MKLFLRNRQDGKLSGRAGGNVRRTTMATAMPAPTAISTAIATTTTTTTGSDLNGQQLWNAAKNGNVTVATQVLRQGNNTVHVDFKGGEYESSPLHEASKNGHSIIAQLLIDHKASVNARDKENGTPLHRASWNGQLEIVELLIMHDADVNAKDKYKLTPLHEASLNGHLGTVELLIRKGADVTANNCFNRTPLHLASKWGHSEIVELLLEQGADAKARNSENKTPLQLAQEEGHAHVINAFESYIAGDRWDASSVAAVAPDTAAPPKSESASTMMMHQEDPPAPTLLSPDALEMSNGQELWNAAQKGNIDLVRQLLQKGNNAMVDFKWGPFNSMPLHEACYYGHWEITDMLIQNGADMNHAIKSTNRTPLHCATGKGHTKVVQLLIENGSDVNAQDNENNTPLHVAIFHAHSEIAQLLIEHDANVNAENDLKKTPLHIASSQGLLEIVELLIANGGDVNASDKYNETPLHVASLGGHLRVLETLLKMGADAKTKTNGNETPLQLAQKRGHANVIQALETHIAAWSHASFSKPTDESPSMSELPHPVTQTEAARMAPMKSKVVAVPQDTAVIHSKPTRPIQDPDGNYFVHNAASLASKEEPPFCPVVGTTEMYPFEYPQPMMEVDQQILVEKLEQVQVDVSNKMKAMDEMLLKLSQMDLSSIGHSEEELTQLVEQFDLLFAVAMDKQQDLDEQIERQSIFASTQHREFYCMLFHKLDCTVMACKSLASDMVQQTTQGSYRAWLSSLLTATSVKAIMEKTPLGQLVRDSIKWAAEQVPLPFIKTFGAVIHALCSFKQEHDKYLAVARLAVFASIAEEMGGTSRVLARVARYMVRSGRFVREQPVFAPWQAWALEMLAEPSTRSQAQGSLVAELVLECIMMPCKNSPIQKILNGQDQETTLDVAIASLVLDLSVDEVNAMIPFATAEAHQQMIACGRNISPVVPVPLNPGVDGHKRMAAVGGACCPLQQYQSAASLSIKGTGVDLADVLSRLEALEDEKLESEKRIHKLEEENKRLKHNENSKNQQIDAGGGLVQMYANEEQRYEGRLEQLEQEMVVTNERMNNLTVGQIEQREMAQNHAHDIQAQIDAIHAQNNRPRRGLLFRGPKPAVQGLLSATDKRDRSGLDP